MIDTPLRILLSYHYYRNVDLNNALARHFADLHLDIFADSGAFSAMTQGAKISLEGYATWIKKWKHLISCYANLDVIMDAETTWENQQRLEDMGLQPIPVFHVLEDWKWLEHYVERYSYIALGVAGMQQRKDAVMAWLARCFAIAGDRAVFHGFALTSWQVMKAFPWYSVDSSSWGRGFRYGEVPVFCKREGRFLRLKLGDLTTWIRHAGLVQSLGFNPADFGYRKNNSREKVCAISALSYILAERWLRKHHGEIEIPNSLTERDLRDTSLGLKIYLVVTSHDVPNVQFLPATS